MGPVTRQDMQNIIETSKNRLLERIPSKQEFIQLSTNVRLISDQYQQQQQLFKSSEFQRSQLTRRIVALETKLTSVEIELKNITYLLSRIAEQRAQPTAQQVYQQSQQEPQSRPAFNPARYVFNP